MTARQGNKARIVMTCGKVIAEFVDGIAEVNEASAAVLGALGYDVEKEETEASDVNDTAGKTETAPAGNKLRKGRKLS